MLFRSRAIPGNLDQGLCEKGGIRAAQAGVRSVLSGLWVGAEDRLTRRKTSSKIEENSWIRPCRNPQVISKVPEMAKVKVFFVRR